MKTGATIPFAKFSGAGNDFVLIDAREAKLPRSLEPWVRAVCRRGVSVGADGVAVILGRRRGALSVRFYNPDGRRHAFCGNATRCVARWEALRRGRDGEVLLDTDAGHVRARVRGRMVHSDLAFVLGEPRHRRVRLEGEDVWGYEVLAGVPHFVLLKGVPENRPLPPLAERLRWHRVFRSGANIDFVGPPRAGERSLRTFERGVERETLACGSGCVAAALALAHRNPRLRTPLHFRVRSGARISIHFRRRSGRLQDVTLCGEARLIYHGYFTREAIVLTMARGRPQNPPQEARSRKCH
jgi:diaminopimelate epimerase